MHKKGSIKLFLLLFIGIVISYLAFNSLLPSPTGLFMQTQSEPFFSPLVHIACGDILVADTVLDESLLCNTDPALAIGADNVELDCNGFTITYDTDGTGADGITATDINNATIKNCIITDGNSGGSTGIGILFTRVNNSLAENNTIQTNGTDNNYGMELIDNANNNTIANNSVYTLGTNNTNIGIALNDSSSGNNIINNIVNTNGTNNNYGIWVSLSNNSLINNNTVQTSSISNITVLFVEAESSAARANAAKNALLNQPGIASIDIFDAKAGTPVMADLQGYDVLLAWSFDAFADSDAVGDLLADYVDAGGAVVTAMFGMFDSNAFPGRIISGRFNSSGYFAITPSSVLASNLVSLGVNDANSPVMEGVNTVTFIASTFRITTVIAAEATEIAQFSNGVIMAAVKNLRTRRVDINFNPVPQGSASAFGINPNSNGVLMIRNALFFAANSVERNNFGIYLTNSSNNSVNNTNISTSGLNSYGVFVADDSANNSLYNTIFSDTVEWLSSDAGSESNFTNTTFWTTNGSINFLELFNVSGEVNATRSLLNISLNNSFLNSTNLSFLNVSAQITLNDVSFSNPMPLADFDDDGIFEECFFDNCTEESFAGNVFIFNVSHFTSYAAGKSSITDCGNVAESNILSTNISSAETCLNIITDNVELDCNGFTITYDTGGTGEDAGINVSDRNNITIKNCIVSDGDSGGSNGVGILFTRVNNSLAENNTIQTNGIANNHGIRLENSSNQNIINNTNITTSGTTSYGIFLADSNSTFNNTFLYDTVEWIISDETSENNFTNTTFWTTNGSIDITAEFSVNGSANVTRTLLNVSLNNAFLNTTNLTFMNVSGTVELTGLESGDKFPTSDLSDSELFFVCPQTVCTGAVSADGTITFNVSHFTSYSTTNGSINLTLSKSDSSDPVTIGNQFNYTIMLNVTGGIASNISLTENYPAEISFVNASPLPDAGDNFWIVGNLTANQTFEINITTTANSAGNANNTINISYNNASGHTLTANVSELTIITALAGQGGGFTTNKLNQGVLIIPLQDKRENVKQEETLNATTYPEQSFEETTIGTPFIASMQTIISNAPKSDYLELLLLFLLVIAALYIFKYYRLKIKHK